MADVSRCIKELEYERDLLSTAIQVLQLIEAGRKKRGRPSRLVKEARKQVEAALMEGETPVKRRRGRPPRAKKQEESGD